VAGKATVRRASLCAGRNSGKDQNQRSCGETPHANILRPFLFRGYIRAQARIPASRGIRPAGKNAFGILLK